MIKKLFKVCDIVTLKVHPLKEKFRIKGDVKLVPPLMMIKEVHIEDKKKKVFDEELGVKIADRYKYLCVYFDDNRMEFKQLFVYHSMLISFDELNYERISDNRKITDSTETLIDEVKGYETPVYEFGKILYFRTKKLEIYKKKSAKKISLKEDENNLSESKIVDKIKESLQYLVCYSSPDFIISGLKINDEKKSFFNDGKPRKIVCEKLVKVLWFNSMQQKNSEQYLPLDFFTDIQPFKNKALE
jgi:hypothetical protein